MSPRKPYELRSPQKSVARRAADAEQRRAGYPTRDVVIPSRPTARPGYPLGPQHRGVFDA